jgi:hypothetical protein
MPGFNSERIRPLHYSGFFRYDANAENINTEGPFGNPKNQLRSCVDFRESSMRIVRTGSEAPSPFGDPPGGHSKHLMTNVYHPIRRRLKTILLPSEPILRPLSEPRPPPTHPAPSFEHIDVRFRETDPYPGFVTILGPVLEYAS